MKYTYLVYLTNLKRNKSIEFKFFSCLLLYASCTTSPNCTFIFVFLHIFREYLAKNITLGLAFMIIIYKHHATIQRQRRLGILLCAVVNF